jgi:sulfur dioxygenase
MSSSSSTTTTTNAALAALGGLFLGAACTTYMIVAGRVAGCSGSVKAVLQSAAPGLGKRGKQKSQKSQTSKNIEKMEKKTDKTDENADKNDDKNADKNASSSSSPPPPPPKLPNVLFFFGLVVAGAVCAAAAPWCFEPFAPLADGGWAVYAVGGALVGSGTYLGNGCTSGHGLAGLSRLSLRSLVATPTFMAAAALTASAKSSFAVGAVAPFVGASAEQLAAYGWVALGLAVLAIPMVVMLVGHGKGINKGQGPGQGIQGNRLHNYAGAWCGLTFGAGLCFGGMARPTAISGALTPQRFDLTLWILFTTALVVTFVGYRVAEHCVAGRRHKARAQTQGPVDAKLVLGALLFGVGWGLTGMCPGPVLVGLSADFGSGAVSGGPILMLGFVVLGQVAAAGLVSKGVFDKRASGTRSAAVAEENGLLGKKKKNSNNGNAPVAAVRAALRNGANVLDVRGADEREADANGIFVVFEGAVNAVYNRAEHTLPSKCLPSDIEAPLVVICKSGTRARWALEKTEELDKYNKVLCCSSAELREAISGEGGGDGGDGGGGGGQKSSATTRFIPRAHNLTNSGKSIFLQFQDPISSTFTYVLGDKETGDAVLIDPVLERLEHDLAKLKELGLSPLLAINTHCHADHITSTGKMKLQLPRLESVISESSGADADVKVTHGQVLTWANGTRSLKCVATPGHTAGCMSFIDEGLGCVFTGDCLLIDGCGRTDFQGGSSDTLYGSVHRELFSLDPATLVYPGHDYKGRACSTIGHEKKYNSRLTKTLPEYVDLMANLGLSFPKKLDVAVPANMRCGV